MSRRQRPLFSASVCAMCMVASGFLPDPILEASEGEIRRIAITIEDQEVAGDSELIRVTQGDRVELVWSTDETVQLHLHGYDIEIEVTPEAPAVMYLLAHATGRFPVTSHGFGTRSGHDTLLYLEVYPD